jgi:murein DD-endopeptidase MepM/ murein hydrolase activator NlpD
MSRARKTSTSSRPSRRGTIYLAAVLGALVLINLYVFVWNKKTSVPAVMERAALAGEAGVTDETPGAALAQADLDDGASETDESAPVPEQEEPGRWIEGEVKKGDSLGRILVREGLQPADRDEIIRALSGVLDFRAIKVGQKYRLHMGDDNRVQAFHLDVSRLVKVRAQRDPGGKLVGRKDQTETRLEVEAISGRIRSSLHTAVKATGEDTSLVSFFVDVFAYDLDFYVDQHEGDTFRVIVEKEYIGDEFLRYRRVVAAEYAGKAGTYRAFWWQAPGAKNGRYYDEKGTSVEKSLLKTPLKYTRVSSGFNPKRYHPVLHRTRAHLGIDYAAPTGTPVRSAASGTIVSRGPAGGAGNMVIVKHEGGMQTVYMHLSRFAKGQKIGQRVAQKDVIGYVGMTGLATGPHLHFGVKMNGSYVDPMKLKIVRSAGVAKKDLADFRRDTAALVTRLAAIEVPDENAADAAAPFGDPDDDDDEPAAADDRAPQP